MLYNLAIYLALGLALVCSPATVAAQYLPRYYFEVLAEPQEVCPGEPVGFLTILTNETVAPELDQKRQAGVLWVYHQVARLYSEEIQSLYGLNEEERSGLLLDYPRILNLQGEDHLNYTATAFSVLWMQTRSFVFNGGLEPVFSDILLDTGYDFSAKLEEADSEIEFVIHNAAWSLLPGTEPPVTPLSREYATACDHVSRTCHHDVPITVRVRTLAECDLATTTTTTTTSTTTTSGNPCFAGCEIRRITNRNTIWRCPRP